MAELLDLILEFNDINSQSELDQEAFLYNLQNDIFKFPTLKQISKKNSSLAKAFGNFGGITEVKNTLKIKLKAKPPGYWQN